MTQFMTGPRGQKLAFSKIDGAGPTVVFLGGFMSDMTGSKAIFLEDWAKARGQAFLRFDYAAHGQSEGVFTEHSVAEWSEDAAAVIAAQTSGDLILIGSSMGGWISLNLGRDMRDRLRGLILIAAAPDFTEDSMLASFTEAQKQEIAQNGVTYIASDYGDPYPISYHLLTDSRRAFVMRDPLVFGCPVHMMQGTLDNAVSRDTALRLLDHIQADDLHLTLTKGADHSYSTPPCLTVIQQKLECILES